MKSKRAVGSLPRFTLASGAITLLFVLTAAPSGQALETDVPDWPCNDS
jgi:hypothetical protein